ncbi:unnamed protein product [Mesocestoides corti]|uniref:DDRGK domain-containing protein 1 n=1 Tax=Mesocestoides corti TaxID=53468 RepID=A0A0R3UE37_MESCO|nr:unnamed protein product [Mesocestoides corti]
MNPSDGRPRLEKTQKTPGSRHVGGALARRRRQQRAGTSTTPQPSQLMTESDFESLESGGDEETSENSGDAVHVVEPLKKKIGTKKAQKLAEKERRKEEREAEERYREALRKKEDEEIRKRKEAEAKAAAAEAALAAAEEKRRLEQELREQAEYEKLKATFSIEGEGVGVKQLDKEAEEQLNREFVDAIKEAKIISLERLCIEFEMKTDACVEKIKSLLSEGLLSGVLDDRGKFLYIEQSEYEAIAKFIELRGRVTISELVEHGNRIIKARTSG